ncbi:hypothetical protein A3H09_03850 [Candidatus Falkowbacteria bacterium RIFCSPLOWO2_12_FULL_45_13]|uniref:EF-hand domain-containing protein n=2 Tax=Candidatus Falkowiibacteriota TaxID=1752728 RepID=A0A1F5SC68_9BACT|nr:MAG: hypothetical protein A3H66_00685 [Candidatus Falkowbacteria bacterium RIFCSPLOWO2_02_FULL_45_21]OGF32032.1 MAG: hypothetical protein A3H09_03850 [Candidatus Falkowbacteria bacterium RIFCSPLOWO2_12_FULL_45_13]
MFNPLNFFKKKSTELSGFENSASEPVVEKKIQIDNVAVHTMPERFRHLPAKAEGAKTAGFLIMGGGLVFLIAVSVLAYFYLFKQPAGTVKEEQPAVTAGLPELTVPAAAADNQAPEVSATSTDISTATTTESVLPPDISLATSTATSTPETVPIAPIVGLIPSLDSDYDGLTDAEEILLGTATSTPDTDSDGYLDGAELINLYDPSASSTKLIANPGISFYENKTFGYSLLYPGVWQLTVNGGDDSIMFKSEDNQFFQVITQANAAKQTLDQWYIEQLTVAAVNDSDRSSGSSWQGIKNLDGLTVYLMDAGQNYIFTLAYTPGENNILDYIDIFDMMARSFTLK